MLLVFLSLGTLMIGCFFAYHCSLIARGMTSYETFKWQDYKDHCMEMAQESRCSAQAVFERGQSRAYAEKHVKCCTSTAHLVQLPQSLLTCRPATSYKSWQLWSRWRESAAVKQQGKAMMSENLYNKGVLRNLEDALVPAKASTARKQL